MSFMEEPHKDKFRELVKLFALKSNHINGIESFWSKAYVFCIWRNAGGGSTMTFMLYYRHLNYLIKYLPFVALKNLFRSYLV